MRRRIIISLLIILASVLCRYANLVRPSLWSVLRRPFTSTTTMPAAAPPPPVVVVGSGLAGLSAAYEALQHGAPSVQLFESAPKAGGNSMKASSGMNGAGTRYQQRRHITDDSFYEDTVRSAGRRFRSVEPAVDRAGLAAKLVEGSAAAVEWLVDEMNVDLSIVAALGGHTVARTHRGRGTIPPGAAIITGLLRKLNRDDRFTMHNKTRVTALVSESGAIRGVEYETEGGETHGTLRASAVVFAAGGFAGDATGLLARYRPDLEGMPSTNEDRPGAHDMLAAVDAQLLDMDSVQIHPTGFVDPAHPDARIKFLAAEMLRGHGAILLSSQGVRFVNEMDTRERVSDAIMGLPGAAQDDKSDVRQWDVTLLLDPGAAKAAATHLGFYEWKGLLRKVKVRDLSPAVIASVDQYAAAVEASAEDEFGRSMYGDWALKPGEANRDEVVHVGRVTPIVHFTMGGVAIDDRARVLRKDDEGALRPIEGLFAAGEITGGIHGDNRLGGSSLLECVVFGRTAGSEAAR